MSRVYIVCDSRAIVDFDRATVMAVADTRDEAIREALTEHGQCVVLSYEKHDGKLTDRRREWADPRLRAEGWPTK